MHSSCEIEDFVETHLCKLYVNDIPIARITGRVSSLRTQHTKGRRLPLELACTRVNRAMITNLSTQTLKPVWGDRWQCKAISLAKKFPNSLLGLFAERFRVTSLWGKNISNVIFLALWSCGPTGQFVYFSSSPNQHCPPNTNDLRSRDRDNPWSLLFVADKVT